MIIYYNIEEIDTVAKIILSFEPRIICLMGELGAGKTTMVKAIMTQLNSADAVSSPTFNLHNTYEDFNGKVIGNHFDLYRMENPEELDDLELYSYFKSPALTLIEWPELILNELPKSTLFLKMAVVSEDQRSLEILSKLDQNGASIN